MLLRRVTGKSMLPALRSGQIVLARQRFYQLRVGDVVIARHNGLEKIKRVAGFAGGSVILHGDNSSASTDSRQFGPVPRDHVIGKLVFPRPRATTTSD